MKIASYLRNSEDRFPEGSRSNHSRTVMLADGAELRVVFACPLHAHALGFDRLAAPQLGNQDLTRPSVSGKQIASGVRTL